MKARCIMDIDICGITFRQGEEYEFEEQVFTEEYTPAIHPVAPARGQHIRYMRYKINRVAHMDWNPGGMAEVKMIYFYDLSYCMHHNYRDERGRRTECFDNYFAIIMPSRNKWKPPQKKQLYPRKDPLVIECPESIKKQMRSGYQDWVRQMLGGMED